ncbi:hypothetical protein DSC45_17775 [Streptomyces sp. YIM 130001]|uniref:hypothetical protein n=1 Tax=Streptomyces sp. YIM 130001 TaxID=2259644 RepID=UPI000ED3755E|nr:hypothetical protein [Streptomyces sp. YIM 130001]RII15682.1 hypothetical protein DSC45_17775 [Streptomyces sp. YIM 130001]
MTRRPHRDAGRPSGSGESNSYRFSPDFIDRMESLLTKVIFIGLGVAALLVVVGLIVGGSLDGDVPEEDGRWMLAWIPMIAGAVVGGLAILGPLLLGCVMGGLAIHRFGWIPGVVLFAGILLTAGGAALDGPYVGWGVAALVVGVLGFFFVGSLSRVPMRIGGARLGKSRDERRDERDGAGPGGTPGGEIRMDKDGGEPDAPSA